MPTSKKRKTKPGDSAGRTINYGANVGKISMRSYLIVGAIAVALVGYGGYRWSQDKQSGDEFSALLLQGQDALSRVRSQPSQGSTHLNPGETKTYASPFPTSGDHDASPSVPGFYTRELPGTGLVHSLEHGNIVIYYDEPGAAAIQMLKDWTALYDGQLDGVIATTSPGLGAAVVLTAWTKFLRLKTFDAAAAAAFVDAYRGRGPEAKVR